LVDTNVLLDIATDDPIWSQWSIGHIIPCNRRCGWGVRPCELKFHERLHEAVLRLKAGKALGRGWA
jgi:hypothetical protein